MAKIQRPKKSPKKQGSEILGDGGSEVDVEEPSDGDWIAVAFDVKRGFLEYGGVVQGEANPIGAAVPERSRCRGRRVDASSSR